MGNEIDDKPLSIQDTLNAFKEDDEKDEDVLEIDLKEEEEEEKEEKKGKGKEKDEEEEIELEKEPSEEDLELSENISRKAILKAYPDLFKKFPALERAFYREQAYTEVFSSIQDAKDAAEKTKEFDKFESALLEGDSKGLLEGVKAADNEAFVRLADSFLPTLQKVDQGTYFGILSNVIRSAINTVAQAGHARGNDNLKAAGLIFNEYFFGDGELKNPTPLIAPKEDKKDDGLSKREQEFRQRQIDNATEELNTRVTNTLTATIEQYIDPKESLSPYARKAAISDVLNQVDEAIQEDSRFLATYNKLWEKAAEEDFSVAAKEKIKKAYINKARTLLAPAIKKVRAEALKESRKTEKTEDKKPTFAARQAPRTESSREKGETKKHMSTLEFLSQD